MKLKIKNVHGIEKISLKGKQTLTCSIDFTYKKEHEVLKILRVRYMDWYEKGDNGVAWICDDHFNEWLNDQISKMKVKEE